ncbi:Hypothetical protein DEACI_1962 [Acididesulfobacillus acetoxydans]|uniref:Uncharacterized protein n=1 Tax=Acididesulfobacillus acetoxydans TaxID=1561005 RepID=A0A8S0XBI9_9FIRM|nr:hypothetical protein [Acididesulfobacillus acetoxydans]CAA7601296.1 Hypothetical protein DEACI_1962 [Acididesulfobacillus acetoxydans]CEJ08794.1 Hypothetical protein DEACI_3274 [Acididesulfobacillus acetoxydans]
MCLLYESGRILSIAFTKRSEADYDDFVIVSEEEAEKMRLEVRLFIDEIKRAINSLRLAWEGQRPVRCRLKE